MRMVLSKIKSTGMVWIAVFLLIATIGIIGVFNIITEYKGTVLPGKKTGLKPRSGLWTMNCLAPLIQSIRFLNPYSARYPRIRCMAQ